MWFWKMLYSLVHVMGGFPWPKSWPHPYSKPERTPEEEEAIKRDFDEFVERLAKAKRERPVVEPLVIPQEPLVVDNSAKILRLQRELENAVRDASLFADDGKHNAAAAARGRAIRLESELRNLGA